jgi:hypothetical protein
MARAARVIKSTGLEPVFFVPRKGSPTAAATDWRSTFPRKRQPAAWRSPSDGATRLCSSRLIKLIVCLGGVWYPWMLLEIAHHGLLEVIGARAGGAGYQ